MVLEILALQNQSQIEQIVSFEENGIQLTDWKANKDPIFIPINCIWDVVVNVPLLTIVYNVKERETKNSSNTDIIDSVEELTWTDISIQNASDIQEWWKFVITYHNLEEELLKRKTFLSSLNSKELKSSNDNEKINSITANNTTLNLKINASSQNSEVPSPVHIIGSDDVIYGDLLYDDLKKDSKQSFSPRQEYILNRIVRQLNLNTIPNNTTDWHELRNIESYIHELTQLHNLEFSEPTPDSQFNKQMLQRDINDLEMLINSYFEQEKIDCKTSDDILIDRQKIFSKLQNLKKRSTLLKREINGDHVRLLNKLKHEAQKVELKHKKSAEVIRNYYSKSLSILQKKLSSTHSRFVHLSSSMANMQAQYNSILSIVHENSIELPDALKECKIATFVEAATNTEAQVTKQDVGVQKQSMENAIAVNIPSLGSVVEVPESVADAISRSLVTIDTFGLETAKESMAIGVQTIQQDEGISNFNFLKDRLETARLNYENKLKALTRDSIHQSVPSNQVMSAESLQIQLEKYKSLCGQLKKVLLQNIEEQNSYPSIEQKMDELQGIYEQIVKEKENLTYTRLKLMEEEESFKESVNSQRETLKHQEATVARKIMYLQQSENTLQKRSEEIDRLHKESIDALKQLLQVKSIEERRASLKKTQMQLEKESEYQKNEIKFISKIAIKLEVEKIISRVIYHDINRRHNKLEMEEENFRRRVEKLFWQQLEEKCIQTEFSSGQKTTPRYQVSLKQNSPQRMVTPRTNVVSTNISKSLKSASYIERGLQMINGQKREYATKHSNDVHNSLPISQNFQRMPEYNVAFQSDIEKNLIGSPHNADSTIETTSQNAIVGERQISSPESISTSLPGITQTQAIDIRRRLELYSNELHSLHI